MRPATLGQEKVSRLASGNLSASGSGGLLSGNIFDNCSPGSLIGSLKPFVKSEPKQNSCTGKSLGISLRMSGEATNHDIVQPTNQAQPLPIQPVVID